MSEEMKQSGKKEYSFGEYEELDFESLVSSLSQGFENLAIYARIAMPPADCADMFPADLCLAPP